VDEGKAKQGDLVLAHVKGGWGGGRFLALNLEKGQNQFIPVLGKYSYKRKN
jgi:hypothetical protein